MILIDPPGRWLTAAAAVALHSEHGIYKMGALLVRGGNVIGTGWNKNRTHPKAKNYTRKIHAELAAILNAGFVRGTHNTDMYVVRMTNGGAMATSKPCNDCALLIRESGIKSVTFINEKGEIRCMKF